MASAQEQKDKQTHLLYGFSKNTEITEKKVDVEEALQRTRRPMVELSVNMEVYGAYALPESWKSKIDDPTEQSYTYEVECLGMQMTDGKVVPKEKTEDEKAEAAAAGGGGKGGKPPAKDAKKGAKEEEPTPEELEKAEQDRLEKEERDKKLAEEWELLDDETKHIRLNEDIFKEPCVKMQNLVTIEKVEKLQAQLAEVAEDDEAAKEPIQKQIDEIIGDTNIGKKQSLKNGYELVELEEFTKQDKGCWLRFMKMPPSTGDADPKKAAPKGGKGAPTDDLKSCIGRAWVNFADLLQPGAVETKQRVFLQTCAPLTKKTNEDGTEEEVEETEFEKVFEEAKSYVHLKLTVSEPVCASTPEKPEPIPSEIVPIKQFITWPYSKDPCDDFSKQVTLAVESMAKEFYNQFKKQYIDISNKKLTEAEEIAKFDECKKEFFYEINTQGKYHILKEKMKKSIVRIVKEHFKRNDQSIKGITRDSRDHFYSELYNFLVARMRMTVKQLVERKRNELHNNIIIPKEQGQLETDHLIEKTLGESTIQRYKRLSMEQEDLYNNQAKAEEYVIKLCDEMEGDQDALLEAAKFYLRKGDSYAEKAEQYLRDAYSFGMKNQSIALMYACLLIQIDRKPEAFIILTSLSNQGYEISKVNLLLSIATDGDAENQLESQKYKATALIEYMRTKEKIPDVGTQKSREPGSHMMAPPAPSENSAEGEAVEAPPKDENESAPAFKNIRLDEQEENIVYIELAEFLLEKSLSKMSLKCLDYVTQKDTSRVQFCLIKAKMLNQQYGEAAEDLGQMINNYPDIADTHILYGHCQFLLDDDENALGNYYKAIRISNIQKKKLTDNLLHQRIGAILVKQKKWHDAKVMFEMCASNYPTAFSFMNLGISCLYLEEYENSEMVLRKANILDTSNANVWGYMTLAMLKNGKRINNAFQALKESIRLQIDNKDLMLDIAKAFSAVGEDETAKKALEYAIFFRAKQQGDKKKKKVQEFLLQISKVLEVNQKQKDENNPDYAELANDQITQIYQESLIKNGVVPSDDQLSQLLIDLHLKSL